MYLAVPVYFDHFEPLIPSIASAWLNGSPIYAPLSSSTIYGVVYGPLVFQFCAIGLKLLGANVFSSKIMFVGAFVIASLATYSSIRLRGISLRIALFTTSAMLVTYGAFGHFPFWTRPDPILTLVSSLGILVMSTASLSRTSSNSACRFLDRNGLRPETSWRAISAASVAIAGLRGEAKKQTRTHCYTLWNCIVNNGCDAFYDSAFPGLSEYRELLGIPPSHR